MHELILFATTLGLVEALQGYDGLTVDQFSSAARVRSLLASAQPPEALYFDDTRTTLEEVWEIVQLGQAHGVRVLLGLQSVAWGSRTDFEEAGIPVSEYREAGQIAAWIAGHLGVAARAASAGQVVIAVGGAKGGIGKSLVVDLFAQTMHRRGLRVLVVDGDISNSGIVPTFRIPSGFPSYLHLKQPNGDVNFSQESVRRVIYHHEATGLHFLLGGDELSPLDVDLNVRQWQLLMQVVRSLPEYDVVLVDTGPEIKKRPYAALIAQSGGYIIAPCPPGRKERTGFGNLMNVLAQETPDLTEQVFVLFMEPERGVSITIPQIAPLVARQFPKTRVLGSLPRDPRLVSLANEDPDIALCPLDLAPHSRLSRAVHVLVDQLCRQVGLYPPKPMPTSSWWQRLRGERITSPNSGAPTALAVRTGEA